jgi:pantetheine-phosphate adenylyltransferase
LSFCLNPFCPLDAAKLRKTTRKTILFFFFFIILQILCTFATMKRTGVFVGSFNPFTIGHDSIVRRALPLFDRLVIGVVGDNVHKPDMPSAEERMQAIRELYANEKRIEVKPYHGLAMDFAKAEGAQYIIKGVRSVSDFEYEQWQADFNRRIGGIETLLLYSEPELASVSSSALRELQHFGVDITPYLPKKS